MTKLTIFAMAATLIAGPVLAHGGEDHSADHTPKMMAVLKNPEGQEVGTVTADPTASGVMHVVIDVHSLPQGVQAIHIHETGACAPDFKASGGHLTGGKEHGILSENGPHAGDMPNLHIPENGKLTVEYFVPALTEEMIMDQDGSAVIIHAGADDYASHPAGHAGDRSACGVFEATK
ncbi:superoxide dismutase family protein [Paracoccus jiaweipingae]|uniref:superoxide dismutase family protein n=1 Tax=unclassified Paracoccus (in: a-proteobacteria) TaxID=2688777 RepID=UPI0037982F22